jgi:hypothetical protein
MSKLEKREQKIRNNPKDVALEDFEWLINKYGYIRMGGSHAVAVIAKISFPYPRNNPMRLPYVKRLIEIIDRRE